MSSHATAGPEEFPHRHEVAFGEVCSWKVPLQSILSCNGNPACKDTAPPAPPPICTMGRRTVLGLYGAVPVKPNTGWKLKTLIQRKDQRDADVTRECLL